MDIRHILVLRIIFFGAMDFLQVSKQWGTSNIITENIDGTLIYYPISFKVNVFDTVAVDGGNGCYSWGITTISLNGFKAWARNQGNFTLATGLWFSIGV